METGDAIAGASSGPTGADQSVLDALLADVGAEGVTASALQECLTKLDVRKKEALLTLFASAAEHFSTDGAAAGPALDQDADALASELSCSTALASLQARGLAQDEASAHVAALAGQHAEVCSGLQVTLEAAGGVRVAAELQQRLADYDAHVAAGSYTEAAWTGMELEKACAAAPELEGMAAAVEGRIHPLRQYLITAAPQYLPPDAATHVLTAHPPPEHTAAALAEIWRAAEVLGVLLQALQTLATHAVEHSVKPILAAEVAAGAGGVIESPAGSIASSSLSLATTRADGRAGTERLVYKTLKVLCEQGLGGRSELAAQLGEVLWPAAGGAYIAAKLRPVRPQTDAELEAFTRRGGVGVKLEAKAVKLGLIPGEGEGPITGYMQKTVGRFLGVKRARYAAAARDVLTSSAAQETVVVAGEGNYAKSPTVERAGLPGRALFGAASGAEAELAGEHSVLDVGSFTVTRAAQGLSTLMHDAVAEACRSGSPALAQAMCGAVVDMAALLVALPPLAGADAAVELPYPSALRYGDCLHVYRTLCALPHSYAPRLQSLVHVNVNFIAPANRVRTAGDAALDAMVEREKTQLVHVAGEVSACFSGMDDVAAARCRKGVMQLVHGFRRLGAVLRGVLPPAKFVEVAAALAEAACGRICDDILAMSDISVEESERIPKILHDLTSGVLQDAVLLGSSSSKQAPSPLPGQQAQQAPPAESDQLRSALGAATPVVVRLREVCELLQARLKEIRRRWTSGRLAAVGLSSGQVVHLVCALFEDTPPRRDLLQRLGAAEGAGAGFW